MRGKITKNPQFYDRHETNYSRLICQADACTERAAEWMEESEMVPLDRRDSAIATARRLYLYALGCKARAGRMKIGATFKMSDYMVGKVISEIKIIDITEAVEE